MTNTNVFSFLVAATTCAADRATAKVLNRDGC
jgi:hypothetical protein